MASQLAVAGVTEGLLITGWHGLAAAAAATLLLADAGDDVVDAQQHGRCFHGCPEGLLLHRKGVQDAQGLGVRNNSLLAVDAPAGVAGSGMARPQVSHHPHHVGAAVVRQTARDDLQSLRHRAVGVLAAALDGLGLLFQARGQLHLGGATAWQEPGLHDDVASHVEGVLEVALDLVEHVPGGAPQEHRAGLGILALRQEGEVLLPELLDLEHAALGAHHALGELLRAIANVSTCHTSNAVVVSLADAADAGDTALEQEVLGQVGDALLRDHQVRLHLQDIFTDLLHLLFLLHEQLLPVRLLGDLDVCLALSLLVLQGAVEQNHARVLDLPAHAWVSDVLVEHDSVQHAGISQLAALDLLDLGEPLDVDLLAAIRLHDANGLRGLDGQV
mmetsp:Transcript_76262/g.123249  ORF Transcript_76262/g.123249 Transcript_76262/m.123249 type:complete len:388 (+) Transcript_76262:451-1614(+)